MRKELYVCDSPETVKCEECGYMFDEYSPPLRPVCGDCEKILDDIIADDADIAIREQTI